MVTLFWFTKHNKNKLLKLVQRKIIVLYVWLVSSKYIYRLQSYGKSPITSGSPLVFRHFICLIQDTLLAQGFGYAWYDQRVGNIALFLRNFKERNRDIDISCLLNDKHNMDRLRTYKILKTNFVCERYLKEIGISSYKQVFVKFRGGLLDLRANSGDSKTCH